MLDRQGNEKQCAAMESLLVEYLDGRAKPAARHEVEEHLAACAACRRRADEFRLVWSALDDLPEISPSAAFDASLRERIAAEAVRRSFWSWLPSPRLAFAVTALVIVGVWFSAMPRMVNRTSTISELHIAPPPAPAAVQAPAAESDFGMIRDLPELENYDVISKFDALSELPGPAAANTGELLKEAR